MNSRWYLVLVLSSFILLVASISIVTAQSNTDHMIHLPAIQKIDDIVAHTPDPTFVPIATDTPTPTKTPTNTATPTPTNTPTATHTPTPTLTPSPTPCGSLSGEMLQSTTLLPACNYAVTGHVLVTTGVTLTIPPGTRMAFAGPYYIKVEGTLNVNGTSQDPVLLTSAKETPSRGDWAGIYIVGESPSSISYATIEYAGNPLPTGQGALNLENGAHLVDHVVFRDNRAYTLIIGNGDTTVQNSIFMQNEQVITVSGSVGQTRLISNVIENNNGWRTIAFYKSGSQHVFKNNSVKNNVVTDESLLALYGSAVAVTDNLFYGNTIKQERSVIVGGSTSVATLIACNTFAGNKPENNAVTPISTYSYYDNILVTIDQNNLYQGGNQYEVHAGFTASQGIDASNNYWGTTNETLISTRIYDYFDDFNLAKVTFAPFLSESSSCAPQLEEALP